MIYSMNHPGCVIFKYMGLNQFLYLNCLVLQSSLKLLRSALRGGYEEAGLGSRPKLHVTWHPDVTDPICSIVSHTVGHKRVPAFLSRRSQQKQMRQKSKASSKSQARGRKQGTKLKNSEPVYTRCLSLL